MEQVMDMKHATEATGPLTVVLKDGAVPLKAAYIDGGSMDLDVLVYEVHGLLLDGGMLCVPQDRIERVMDAKGVEVEFGSQYAPGHPRPRALCGACGMAEGQQHHGECQGWPELVEPRDAGRHCYGDPRRADTFDDSTTVRHDGALYKIRGDRG